MPGSTAQKILNKKLGSDKNGVPYYLHLLNLHFGGDEAEKELCLNKYRKLATDLRGKPKIVKELILSADWRPALVGNAVAILLRDAQFQKDLISRLENWSWIAPQLGVGCALLNDGLAENELQRIIETASEESNPKIIMSVYSALKFLENKAVDEFKETSLFKLLKEKDSWDNSIEIANQHWDFWKNIAL